MADIDELALFIYAEDEGAEPLPSPSRCGESSYDRFLLPPGLDLQPFPAPLTGPIGAHAVLRHDALHLVLPGCFEKGDALLLYVVAQSHMGQLGQDLAEDRSPAGKGQRHQIEPVKVEEIENVVDEAALGRFPVVLEQLETGPARFVHHHDLSVEERIERHGCEGSDDSREPFVERLVFPGIEEYGLVPDLCEGAISVPFYLEEPPLPVKGVFHEKGEHGLDMGRHGSCRRTREIDPAQIEVRPAGR